MSAGVPVIALDAPGAREVVHDRQNGRLLSSLDVTAFTEALRWASSLDGAERPRLIEGARETAECFSMERCAARALALYESVLSSERVAREQEEDNAWLAALRVIETEWQLWVNFAKAATVAVSEPANNDAAA
jgi:hypothetical protein